MYKIFICYRTTDSAYTAAHIFTELSREFGKEVTFEYSYAMPAGEKINEYLKKVLQDVQVFIPIIGSGWIDAKDEMGQLRIFQRDDLVRIEIETALLQPNLSIIPLCINGVQDLKKVKLPESIHAINEYNAVLIDVRPEFFSAGVRKLIDKIKADGITHKMSRADKKQQLTLVLSRLDKRKKKIDEAIWVKTSNSRMGCIGLIIGVIMIAIMAESEYDFSVTLMSLSFVTSVVSGIWIGNNKTGELKEELAEVEKQMSLLNDELEGIYKIEFYKQ